MIQSQIQKRWQMSDAIDQVHAQILELMPSFYADVRLPQPSIAVNNAAKSSIIARAWRELYTSTLHQGTASATVAGGQHSSSGGGGRGGRGDRGGSNNGGGTDVCVHIIVVNIAAEFHHVSLSLSGLTDAEVALATNEGLLPLFDGSCSANPGPGFRPGPGEPGHTRATSEYQCRQLNLTQLPAPSAGAASRSPSSSSSSSSSSSWAELVPAAARWRLSDWVAPSTTTVYRLGCGGRDALTAVGAPTANLVHNGDMELVQQAGTDGCVMDRMGCLPTWVTLACNDAGAWTDDRAWVSMSTALPHSGRHSARLQLPTAEPVVVSLPMNSYKVAALCKAVGLGPKQPCAPIMNHTSYRLRFFARASPMGLLPGGGARAHNGNGGGGGGGNHTDVSVLLGNFVATTDKSAGWTIQKFEGATLQSTRLGREWSEVEVLLPAAARAGRPMLQLKFGGAVGAVFWDDVSLLANSSTANLELERN
eukprot:COSAG05_NODE_1955_length_3791_cov_2.398429_1_plen_478_part_00